MAKIQRQTRETDITLDLNLDGTGQCDVSTGIGFFDHMLTAFGVHGLFDIKVSCKGDLQVDQHHTVEDVGICLGQALDRALGEKEGIRRFGAAYVPLDEALTRSVVDLCGRPYLTLQADLDSLRVGEFQGELTHDFLWALASNGQFTLHVAVQSGRNGHHIIETIFKSLAVALRQAVEIDPRRLGVPSTKGILI